jgi:hypothetical protein
VAITEAEIGAMLLSEGVDADQQDSRELLLDAEDALDDAATRPETGDLAVRRAGPKAPLMPSNGARVGRALGSEAGLSPVGTGAGAADGRVPPSAGASAQHPGSGAGSVPDGGIGGEDSAAAPPDAAPLGTLRPDRAWTPTPVPPPAYTLREQAERREPKPLTEADYEAAREAAARLTAASPSETGRIALPPRVIFGESTLDIDTAITKRRAAQ